ncbi:PLD nuclease N-terminal domain-containing protein [Streptomyces natalensis]|uniref:Cardiolipin synthase N-terminal domain-containing protein n=1 Tax=Streptomyces natalensis ATCC 27448 TaxID=1240678 RepID=A0A0D7CDA0_9ACTN|nr:PLD nuclease N-terminal domain-containing protein [Streptomyces natalensis]KIZ13307.1 hypothetical protein SNA_38260 [Streptomyces natalensis ATCC 27448]
MFLLRYLPFLLVLALWIYAFIDCLNTPESQVRGLPKVVWVLVILLFGEVLVGPIAWLAAGKHRGPVTGGGSTPAEWHRNHSSADGVSPARAKPRARGWIAPDDNPEFLRSLKEENKKDEALLKDWEADLRRREEELRRKQEGAQDGTANGPEDTPPAAKE